MSPPSSASIRAVNTPPDTPHLFRLPPLAANDVSLKGDFIDWFKRHGMEAAADGGWELELALAPGVYLYKFQPDGGAYLLDAANPRTAWSGGHRNSLLVVGGTEEPVVHAPTRPYLFVAQDGALVLRARLRRGAGTGLDLLTFGEEGELRHAMTACGEDAEHLSFEHVFDGGAPAGIRYLFEVVGPGQAASVRVGRGTALAPFDLKPRDLPRLEPDPFVGRSIYRIVLDRFRAGGGSGLAVPGPGVEEHAGGDLRGVIDALPHLAELGADALLLTPLGRSPTYHRYDLQEPAELDPTLGTEEDLAELVAGVHARGMKLLLDLSVSHVNPAFPPFQDLLAKGPRSRYRDWFFVLRWPIEVSREDPAFLHYPDGPHLPMLNTRNPEVVAWLARYVTRWTRAGIDGWRLDAVADVPRETMERLVAAARKVNPRAIMVAELVPDGAPRYLGRPAGIVTDFPASNALLRFFLRREGGAEELATTLAARSFAFGAEVERMLLFLADLDQSRPLTLAQDPALVRLAGMFLFTLPCTPLLLYGDEVGLSCGREAGAFEQGLDRVVMRWSRTDEWDRTTLRCLRELLWLRQEAPIAGGAFRLLHAAGPVLAWARSDAQEEVLGLVNVGDAPAALAHDTLDGAPGRELWREGVVNAADGAVHLGPRSGAIFRRVVVGPEEREPAREDPALRNLARVDRAFRRGALAGARPTRWYLNLTERCNLRCAHCITCAPERTAARTARDMEPAVLERLLPHLEEALYVGLVHSGEPTLAPLLEPMLRGLREVRGGRPTVVHLLTNGMTLNEERFVRLAGLGVNSVSFSIDGASARTNDVLRVGSRFEHLAALLPALTRLRKAQRLDVRMGMAFTVTASNVGEVPAAVRFAAQAGLDWIKFEETYPLNAVSEREARIAPATLRRALAGARAAQKGKRLVLLEHLDPPRVWKCRLGRDAVARKFSQGDDYVNRMHINPCRLPFELACVEPDGDLKPLDFHRPAAGNLLRQDLWEIWEGVACHAAREASFGERRCPQGCATCAPDPGPKEW